MFRNYLKKYEYEKPICVCARLGPTFKVSHDLITAVCCAYTMLSYCLIGQTKAGYCTQKLITCQLLRQLEIFTHDKTNF